METLIQSEKFAYDEIVSLEFFFFDTTNIPIPKTRQEYFKYWNRLKYLHNGELPKDYYIFVCLEYRHLNKNYQDDDVVMVKFNQRFYYLPASFNNTLFKITGEEQVQEFIYSKEKIRDLFFRYGFAKTPVISVENGMRMSYLNENHPIYLILHE